MTVLLNFNEGFFTGKDQVNQKSDAIILSACAKSSRYFLSYFHLRQNNVLADGIVSWLPSNMLCNLKLRNERFDERSSPVR